MMGQKGSSLTELMVTVGIVGIIGIGAASAFTFAATQFGMLREENSAETSLQEAAYYLKLFMTNALKVQCAAGALGNPNPLANTTGLDPAGVDDGLIDCRAGVAWPSTQASALGIFYRENAAFVANTSASSTYQGVGVYYQAPDGTDNNMGNLIFASQGAAATTFVSSTVNTIVIDHISNIQIVGVQTAPILFGGVTYNMLETITYQITARYPRTYGIRDYAPTYSASGAQTAGHALVVDITQQVQIAFHDNYLGPDLTGNPATPTAQRLNGGIYYYKFISPAISNF